jgi:hypothetical protein
MRKPFGVLWRAITLGAVGAVFNLNGQARGFPCSGKHG